MIALTEDDKIRFWNKVDRTGDCWLWNGTTQNRGYGQFWLNYKMELAHRVSYAIETGKETFGNLLHTCDNPRCVNPAHLKEGDQFDNMADMFRKGRQGDCRHFGPHWSKHNFPRRR